MEEALEEEADGDSRHRSVVLATPGKMFVCRQRKFRRPCLSSKFRGVWKKSVVFFSLLAEKKKSLKNLSFTLRTQTGNLLHALLVSRLQRASLGAAPPYPEPFSPPTPYTQGEGRTRPPNLSHPGRMSASSPPRLCEQFLQHLPASEHRLCSSSPPLCS